MCAGSGPRTVTQRAVAGSLLHKARDRQASTTSGGALKLKRAASSAESRCQNCSSV